MYLTFRCATGGERDHGNVIILMIMFWVFRFAAIIMSVFCRELSSCRNSYQMSLFIHLRPLVKTRRTQCVSSWSPPSCTREQDTSAAPYNTATAKRRQSYSYCSCLYCTSTVAKPTPHLTPVGCVACECCVLYQYAIARFICAYLLRYSTRTRRAR